MSGTSPEGSPSASSTIRAATSSESTGWNAGPRRDDDDGQLRQLLGHEQGQVEELRRPQRRPGQSRAADDALRPSASCRSRRTSSGRSCSAPGPGRAPTTEMNTRCGLPTGPRRRLDQVPGSPPRPPCGRPRNGRSSRRRRPPRRSRPRRAGHPSGSGRPPHPRAPRARGRGRRSQRPAGGGRRGARACRSLPSPRWNPSEPPLLPGDIPWCHIDHVRAGHSYDTSRTKDVTDGPERVVGRSLRGAPSASAVGRLPDARLPAEADDARPGRVAARAAGRVPTRSTTSAAG